MHQSKEKFQGPLHLVHDDAQDGLVQERKPEETEASVLDETLERNLKEIARVPHLGSSRYGLLFGRCRGV